MSDAGSRLPLSAKASIVPVVDDLVGDIDATGANRPDDSSGLYEQMAEESNYYFWEWDLATGKRRRYPETERLFGVEKAELEPVSVNYMGRIQSAARERVESTVREAIERCGSYEVEYEFAPAGGTPMWVEEHGTVLTDQHGTPAGLTGINREITERKRREQSERLRRELDETLWDAMLESRTRSRLEASIAERLSAAIHNVAWIGDWRDGALRQRAVDGSDRRIRALELGSAPGRDASLPRVRAGTEGRPQFVTDVANWRDQKWAAAASDCGIRSVAALPLRYRDVLYGIVSVYDETTAAASTRTRETLLELADTMAVVINRIEGESALVANRTICAKLQLVGCHYYLRDLIEKADSEARITVHETLQCDAEQDIQYISVDGADVAEIATLGAEHNAVEDITQVESGQETRLQATHTAQTPEETLADFGLRVRSTSITADRVNFQLESSDRASLQSAISALDASNDSVSVLSIVERESQRPDDRSGPLDGLTDRQRTVLSAAFHQGYFETPREASATAVAESLDISHPTFLEHLRLAQDKLLSAHLGAGE